MAPPAASEDHGCTERYTVSLKGNESLGKMVLRQGAQDILFR